MSLEDKMDTQLYQVWDWKKNQVYSYHSVKEEAFTMAKNLNLLQAMDWNGLPRYQATEAND